jgi:hypothetical protein
MMNVELSKQLTHLLMESYDKGVADAMAAAEEAIEKAVDAAIAAEREACAKVCEDLHPGLATRRAAEIIRARGEA